MHFNVEKNNYMKYESMFPDILESVADRYEKYEAETPLEILWLNRQLMRFPKIDSLRICVFGSWTDTTCSLICAVAIFREYVLKSVEDKMYYYDWIASYYLNNALFRFVSMLDITAQAANVTMNLGLSESYADFFPVFKALKQEHPNHPITLSFQKLSQSSLHKTIREIRNIMTHRRDHMGPSYGFISEELMLGDLGKTLVTVPNAQPTEFPLEKCIDVCLDFYYELSDFLKEAFSLFLDELHQQYLEEIDFYDSVMEEQP